MHGHLGHFGAEAIAAVAVELLPQFAVIPEFGPDADLKHPSESLRLAHIWVLTIRLNTNLSSSYTAYYS